MKDVCTIKFQIFLNIFFQSIKTVFTGVTVPINYDREMEKEIPFTQKKGPSNKLGLSPTGRYEDDALKGNHRLREMK